MRSSVMPLSSWIWSVSESFVSPDLFEMVMGEKVKGVLRIGIGWQGGQRGIWGSWGCGGLVEHGEGSGSTEMRGVWGP